MTKEQEAIISKLAADYEKYRIAREGFNYVNTPKDLDTRIELAQLIALADVRMLESRNILETTKKSIIEGTYIDKDREIKILKASNEMLRESLREILKRHQL